MAPRRRRPKLGLSRMDAATDAMAQYGFPEELVKEVIKDLLKEYGGDEGWPFIEDGAYRELIEAILRKQEGDNRDAIAEYGNVTENDSENNIVVRNAQLDGAETSGVPAGSQQNGMPEDNSVAGIAMQLESALEVAQSEVLSCSSATEDTGRNSNTQVLRNESVKSFSPLATLPPPEIKNPLAQKLREPCYGWIEDDEDGHRFIKLPPAVGSSPLPDSKPSTHAIPSKRKCRKRKSGWDVKPEDL